MARSMLSLGMLAARALSITRRSRGLLPGSPPPRRAAVAISRISLVKIFPRLASRAPFLRLMVAHLEWPDMIAGVARACGDGQRDRRRPPIPAAALRNLELPPDTNRGPIVGPDPRGVWRSAMAVGIAR